MVALGIRHAKASESALDGGYSQTFESYERAASMSEAVVCMPPGRLMPIACDEGLLATFMLQIEGQMRIAQDNEFDSVRSSFEEAYFPGYSSEIRFGALSMDGAGHVAYGSCAVSLKNSAIESRASVFEFPLYAFSQGLNLARPIPAGHRADWGNRGRLASTKAGVVLSGASPGQYQNILLPPPTTTTSDCVEVHIYGALNVHSIKSVSFYRSVRQADIVIQDVIAEALSVKSIPVRMVE
ncbi:hypothetical protein [Xanthomonas euroxanthea]|uniref:hypothetical protein n=1 Tax=Xanthomonas euroxanthea TaxID=2259622 RepID=UPI00141B58C1|nr:hypothetical protein [Xanthomonas euroxanthea]